MKSFTAFLGALAISTVIVLAGKPWRPGVEKLVPESELIVVVKVTALKPSLITDKDKKSFAMAEVQVTETIKGTAPERLRVAVESEPEYDERGILIARSTAFRYELKAGDHSYLLYLQKPATDAVYFVPVHSGSGIVDLDSNRTGDGPKELDALRSYLAAPAGGKKP